MKSKNKPPKANFKKKEDRVSKRKMKELQSYKKKDKQNFRREFEDEVDETDIKNYIPSSHFGDEF